MFRPTQRHWIATTMFAIAASATACSAPDSEIADTATSEHELSGSEVPCGEFLAADIDVIGASGASIVSPATYGTVGASVCAKAYRVNVYDYSAATFNAGTVVGYGGAMPTTKANCEATDVRAYVWRRIATRGADTATVFEDSKIVRGRWHVALDGTGRCLLPAINIDTELKNMTPSNGARDYHFGLSARLSNNTAPVTLVTLIERPLTALDQVDVAAAFRAELVAQAAGTIHPVVAAEFAVRNVRAGAVQCRELQLDLTLSQFTQAALVKAGATTATINARRTALQAYQTALCTANGTAAQLQTALADYLTRTLETRDQIASAIRTAAPAYTLANAEDLAANLLSDVNLHAIGNLVTKCDLQPDPVRRYLSDGTLPAGITDPKRLLLATCSDQTPTAAASSLGFGAPAGGGGSGSGQAQMMRCMSDVLSAVPADRCNSPLAEGAPDGSAANSSSTKCINVDTMQPCTQADLDGIPEVVVNVERSDAEQEALDIAIATQFPPDIEFSEVDKLIVRTEASAAAHDRARRTARGVGFGFGVVPYALNLFIKFKPGISAASKLVLERIGLVAGGIGYAIGILLWVDDENGKAELEWEKHHHEEDFRNWCHTTAAAPFQDLCSQQRHCAPDAILPANAWYEMGSGLPSAREVDIADLFQHCMCGMVDADYASVGAGLPPARRPAASCPKSDEQRKLECVADPRLGAGPDDGPDPTCKTALSPGPFDADVWSARKCQLVHCTGDSAHAFAMPDGSCGCFRVTGAGGAFPDCTLTPFASSGLCTDDAPQACFCVRTDPLPPNGGDPFCRQSPTTVIRPLNNYILPDPDAVHFDIDTSGVERLRVRAGGNTQFAAPQLYPNTFATRGDKLRVKAGVMKAPVNGEVVQLKLYYTNLVRPQLGLTHRFLGQCSMEGFAVGGLNNCDFSLPSATINGQTVNVGTLEDAFSIDFELNTTPSYKTRPILTTLSYAGTTFSTVAARLAPSCPAPGPTVRPVTVPNPLIPVVSPINPRPLWTFPSGNLSGLIPFDTAVLRDLIH